MRLDKINVNPWLATGVTTFTMLIVFSLVEKITSIPFMGKYYVIVFIVVLPIGLIVNRSMWKYYNKEKDNSDSLFKIIYLLEIILFIVIAFVI